MFYVCLFSPNSTLNLSKKKKSVQLSFGCIHRLSSRREPQGYTEQGVEPGMFKTWVRGVIVGKEVRRDHAS